jgi:hypothetical protein
MRPKRCGRFTARQREIVAPGRRWIADSPTAVPVAQLADRRRGEACPYQIVDA